MRRWHPGQDWIWDAGNFGVFDPGINALSILTKIAPAPMFVKAAKLFYPENRDSPIAASLTFSSPAAAAPLTAEFDWRQEGEQSWNIDIETEAGARLRLTHGGSRLLVDGAAAVEAPMQEYEGIYAHFAELLRKGESEMDAGPFQLVGDAFLVGSRTHRGAVPLVSGIAIHGLAIVSRDDRIADAAGAMPDSLRNEADWAYFQSGVGPRRLGGARPGEPRGGAECARPAAHRRVARGARAGDARRRDVVVAGRRSASPSLLSG